VEDRPLVVVEDRPLGHRKIYITYLFSKDNPVKRVSISSPVFLSKLLEKNQKSGLY